MDIPALLHPYIDGLTSAQLGQVSTYLDLLLRWNARTNLTSLRNPEHIVSRHFGESFFLAAQLFGAGGFQLPITNHQLQILDVGSGAGFPAIPLKIAYPQINLTLVEAHHTKAVFLREVLRALHLDAEVKNVRAESLLLGSADLVTLRAVEKFDSILPIAARLIRRPTTPHSGRAGLALLVSSTQVSRAQELLPNFHFRPPTPLPGSQNRVIQLVEPR